MAYSQETWKQAKLLFELGKSLKQIALETGINDRSSISRRAKKDNWAKAEKQQLKADIIDIEQKKATLEQKKATVVEKIATLDDYEITMLDKIVESETGAKSLMFSTASLSLIRKNQMLTKNTKEVIQLETIYGDDGRPISKTPVKMETELSPADIKAIDEGIDKNAVSLELAPRHAPKQDINVAQQQNNNEIVEINGYELINPNE
jgi:hypothetical protein